MTLAEILIMFFLILLVGWMLQPFRAWMERTLTRFFRRWNDGSTRGRRKSHGQVIDVDFVDHGKK